MYLGSREKHNLPLTPAPRSSRTSRVCRGGPARGRCCPSLAVIPHNHFSLETLSANQTTLPGSCRAAFILFPAWPWANAPKNAVSHPETHSGFAWEETTAPNLNLAHLDQFCLLRRPPGEGRQILGFLEVSELYVIFKFRHSSFEGGWCDTSLGWRAALSGGLGGPRCLDCPCPLRLAEPHPCVGQAPLKLDSSVLETCISQAKERQHTQRSPQR